MNSPLNTTNETFVDSFTIHEELAKELTDKLTQKSIREELMLQSINDKEKFEALEGLLIPIIQRIDYLKDTITSLVPEQYRSNDYRWEYLGFNIDGCKVRIYGIER